MVQHVIYAYASLTASGTVSLTAAQTAQVKAIVALKAAEPDLKVLIAGIVLMFPFCS
jgi:hypothetical protein